MWNNGYTYGSGMMWGNQFSSIFAAFILPLAIWSLFWKGWALWRAAKNDSKPWFIVLLIVNVLGILDMLYLFVFGKEKAKETRVIKSTKRSPRK